MARIETERLRLRRLVPGDAATLARLLEGDREAISQTGRMPYPPTEDAIRHWIDDQGGPGGQSFLLVRRADDATIGAAGFGGDGHRVELGYVIGRRFWGRGFATEAVRALVLYARRRGIRTIDAYTFPDNPGSARVLEKTGFADLGVVERDYPKRGGMREVRHFRMTLEGGA